MLKPPNSGELIWFRIWIQTWQLRQLKFLKRFPLMPSHPQNFTSEPSKSRSPFGKTHWRQLRDLLSLLSPRKLFSILPDFGDTAQCSAHDKAVHECEFEKNPIACCWTPLVSKGSWCCDCDTPQKTSRRNCKVYHTYHHGVFNIPDCWRNMEKPIYILHICANLVP